MLAPIIEASMFVVRWKHREPSTVKLDKTKVTIGRSSKNDICIGDPFVSRLHAELKRQGTQVLLRDAGSANGTYLNGRRVTAPIALRPGDRIRVGETEIEYSDVEPERLSLP